MKYSEISANSITTHDALAVTPTLRGIVSTIRDNCYFPEYAAKDAVKPPKYFVFSAIPAAFTSVCAKEIEQADALYEQYKDIQAEHFLCTLDRPHAFSAWMNQNDVENMFAIYYPDLFEVLKMDKDDNSRPLKRKTVIVEYTNDGRAKIVFELTVDDDMQRDFNAIFKMLAEYDAGKL